jgi:hypothetical protein
MMAGIFYLDSVSENHVWDVLVESKRNCLKLEKNDIATDIRYSACVTPFFSICSSFPGNVSTITMLKVFLHGVNAQKDIKKEKYYSRSLELKLIKN